MHSFKTQVNVGDLRGWYKAAMLFGSYKFPKCYEMELNEIKWS